MPMIVENGSGLRLSSSYVPRSEADKVLDAQGHGHWSRATAAEREQALIAATRWIDQTFQFSGNPLSPAQALAWPRVDAVDMFGSVLTGVPSSIRQATITLAAALVATADPLALDQALWRVGARLEPLTAEATRDIAAPAPAARPPAPSASQIRVELTAAGSPGPQAH